MRNLPVFLISVILLAQIASNSFNEVPTQNEQQESIDSSSEWSSLARSNSSGNNNGSGNNTGGNNTGGNNTGGNNTGGNNTGGNSTTSDAHCLELSNLSINQTYFVTLYLVNTCSTAINYPGINASADNSGVQGLYGGWWYMIGASNTSYASHYAGSQLTFNQSIQNGTMITLYFEATVMHCGSNNSWSHQCPNSTNSSLSLQFQYIAPPPRTLSGAIHHPTTNLTTDSSSIDVWYWGHNYTNGAITVNTQVVDYLPSYGPNLTNVTYDNGTILSSNSTTVYLSPGWSTICLHLVGDSNSTFTDCIQVYRNPPIVRLSINSATISNTSGSIHIAYESENFTGYIQWQYTSSNGTSFSSSYIDSNQRTAYLYTDVFGTITVCGTIGNTTVECVTLFRNARQVTGFIDSPANNTQLSVNYIQIGFEANNYSNGSITVNGINATNLYSDFEDEPYYYNNGTFVNRIYNYRTVSIPYGLSTICLELVGEDGTQLSDCISVERIVPPHSVSVTYPTTGANIIGQILDLSYALENSSNHHFTVDGIQTNIVVNTSNPAQLNLGFGTRNVCVVSYDYAGIEFSDCVTVSMIDPNADSDSDSVPDHSDNCANTLVGWSVDSDGCAAYQLDTDSDGVTDDLDVCPNTQQFSNVDANGCAAYQRDSDGDGIMDNLDACPATPANSVVDAYGCAISQIDSDNDGVMDDVDLCPGTFVGSQVNADGCAPSQLDSDSDGIADSFDQCPNSPTGTVVDQTGCPPSSSSNSSGNGSSSGSGGLPSVGIVATLSVVAIAFIAINRREE
tara:strand:+ start:1204 stop:3579 length:2376 start_codon:yes stop_codon:yes gene_type:complete